jgi:hypothetical protein
MALVETKDLSLSPKKVILLFLHPCRVYLFLSLRLFLFFFSWPALRLFDTSKLLPPFFFSFRKTIVWETKSRVFFFEWKREIFHSTLRRRRRQKKNNTWGHGAGGPQTEIALEFENLSLSLIFLFFYYSFPVLQNFKGKILVVSFLITIFFTFSKL